MQITEVRIRQTKKASVKAHAIICFDNCFLVRELKVIQGPAGLSVSFPVKKLSDGTQWDIAFPVNAETRNMIGRAVLAEYEKVVAGSGFSSARDKIISVTIPPSTGNERGGAAGSMMDYFLGG